VPTGQETRVVDPNTGGAKGVKLARFDLLPWDIIKELSEHFGRGARKYDDNNWKRGYKWSLSFGALHRHLAAFWDREEIDDDESLLDEDGVSRTRHIVAVVWHACVLAWFSLHGVGTDDRPVTQRIVEEPQRYVVGKPEAYRVGDWEHASHEGQHARRNVETGARDVWVPYASGGGRWESVEG
jgi:hypothetical protein